MNISKVVLHLKLGDKGIQLTSLALYGARCQDQYKKDLRFLGAGDEQSGEIRMCGRVEIGQQVLQAKLLPFLQMTSKMRETNTGNTNKVNLGPCLPNTMSRPFILQQRCAFLDRPYTI